MKKIKLNKQKLNEKWKEGGRVASKWCNYYLIYKEDKYYLVEVANWKAYLTSVLYSPILLVALTLSALQRIIEQLSNIVDLNSTPLAKVVLTVCDKNKVRTDVIEKKDLGAYKDC